MLDTVLRTSAPKTHVLTAPQIVAECHARPDCPAWIREALWIVSEGLCSAYTGQEQHWLLSPAYTALNQHKWVYGICLTPSEVQLHRFCWHPVTGRWRNGMPHLPQQPQFLPQARLCQALTLCPPTHIPHHELERRLERSTPHWKRAYVQQRLYAPQVLHIEALIPLQRVLLHYQNLLDHWVVQPERYQDLTPAVLKVFGENGDGTYSLQTVPLLNDKLQRIQSQATVSPSLWRSLWRTFFRLAFQRLKWPGHWMPEFSSPRIIFTESVTCKRYTIFGFEAYGQDWEWEIGQQKNAVWLNQVNSVKSPLSPGGWHMAYLPLGLATLALPTLPKEHPVLFPWELFAPIRAYQLAIEGNLKG